MITKGYRVQATMIIGQNAFACIAVLWVSFMWQIVKTHMIRLQVMEGPNTHDQIAFCAFRSFLVQVQRNVAGAGYMHAMHA